MSNSVGYVHNSGTTAVKGKVPALQLQSLLKMYSSSQSVVLTEYSGPLWKRGGKMCVSSIEVTWIFIC